MRQQCHVHTDSAKRRQRTGMCLRSTAMIALLLLASLPSIVGCAGRSSGPKGDPLRVAVAPFYPPIVFEQDGQIMGAEAGF